MKSSSSSQNVSHDDVVCDAIIVLLEQCDREETKLIYDMAQKRIIEFDGDESSIELQINNLLDQCSVVTFTKIRQQRLDSINSGKQTIEKQTSIEKQTLIEKQSIEKQTLFENQMEDMSYNLLKYWIYKIDRLIEIAIIDKVFNITIPNVNPLLIRQYITSHYKSIGYNETASFSDGRVEINIKFMSSKDIVDKAYEKLKLKLNSK